MASRFAASRLGDVLVLEPLGGVTMEVVRAMWPARTGVPAAGEHPYRAAATPPAQVVVARCSFDTASYFADYALYFERLLELREALGPEHCPRVLHVYVTGGRRVACIEEDLGDVSFRSLIDRLRGPLPLRVALYVARAFVSAWAKLDLLGRARDASVEPADVRLASDGRVRLLVSPSERPRPESDPTIVVPQREALLWFAPEVIRGAPAAESAMFGVGMLLFEALVGRHPFRSSTDLEVLGKILEVELPDPHEVMPHVPRSLVELVYRCADKRPEHRFASWMDLRAALDDASRAAEPAGQSGEEELRRLLTRTFHGEDTETITVEMKSRPRWRAGAAPTSEARVEMRGSDGRPMIRVAPTLLVDQSPVTCDEYARYLRETNCAAPRAAPERAALPITGVTLDDAQAYARWARKRIPDGDEWEIAVRTAGPSVLDVGTVWELTTGERAGDGWLVRGGPWRDRIGERGRAENLSYSEAAPDVGFRCVADD